MQKLLSLVLFLSVAIGSTAQNIDALLSNSYSIKEIQDLKIQDPQKYDMLVYAIDHATYLAEFNQQKHGSLNLTELTELTQKPRFTDLKVKIESFNQFFYAPKLDKIVIVKSEWVLNHENSKEK